MGATYLLRAEPPATGPAVTTALRRVTALADTTAVGALPHAEIGATGCAMAGPGIDATGCRLLSGPAPGMGRGTADDDHAGGGARCARTTGS